MAKQEPTVELFYDSAWNDHTADVYTRDAIEIARGRSDESGQPAPTTAALTFAGHDFNPRNPSSPLYGKIGRNTPVRVLCGAISEGFEDATLDITITDLGDAAWVRTNTQAQAGSWSLKSGTITHGQTTTAEVAVPADAVKLQFWYRVSSEAGFDYLELEIDGVNQFTASGEVGWTQSAEFDVSTASTVAFRYIKDGSLSAGEDAAYVDSIEFTLARISGEVSSWVPKQALKGDEWVEVAVAGITRRLSQGVDPLSPPITRELTSPGRHTPVAYWTCEDGERATFLASALPGHAPMRIDGAPELASFNGYVATAPLPVMKAAKFLGVVPAYTVTGQTLLSFLFNASGLADFARVHMVSLKTSGSAARWVFEYDDDFDGTISVYAYDSNEVLIFDSGLMAGGLNTQPDGFELHLEQNGSDINVRAWDHRIDGVTIRSRFNDSTLTGHTVGRVTEVLVAPNQDLVDSTVGHVLVSDTLAHFTNTANLLKGWSGETAGRRIERLCTEEGISLVSVGDLDTTAAVGVQLPVPLMELFTESGDADLGIVTDARASAAILYRTRESLYGQTAALALDYAAAEVAPPLEPVVDDQATRNDVTVSRENGGSYRTSLDTGPLSTQAPPDGVGRYNTSVTVNVADDAQLPDQAGWRLHLGTTRETRYPQVTVDLDASPHLAAAVSAIDIGDRLTIANLPATISPDLASLIVQGYTETIGSHRRVVTFNTTPEQPWVVGVYGATGVTPDPDAPERYSPPEGTETQLVEFVSGTDTVLKSTTTSAGTWSTTADFPYDIDVAGVRLRVTAVSAVLGANQNLTVEQTPINGVTKTIPTGTPIRLWQPAVYAL